MCPSSTSAWPVNSVFKTVGFLMMSHTLAPEKLAAQAQ